MSRPLEGIVAEAQRRGLVGPGNVTQALEHARGFASGVPADPARLLDLGSGGGLPGLPLAQVWAQATVVLLDSMRRSVEFLRWAVDELGWSSRVSVVHARAEDAARDPRLRGTFDLVVARGFGGAATTAECGAGFLRVGGWLVVSEPPEVPDESSGGSRWSAAGLDGLGMGLGPGWVAPYRYQAVRQVRPCPERYPRRVGVPAKRPLW
jgi:16S rRNA (guanine527-N7)-methyltransferase